MGMESGQWVQEHPLLWPCDPTHPSTGDTCMQTPLQPDGGARAQSRTPRLLLSSEL
ncbi:rCG31833 [Rattus norvegicus]|uniref:RCG31833 n=1 Tax=Rattus norvegicus TaxID=10116 RepID=A6JNY2_RAT|nr:rCG31833 [Rattus norvegicus]